MLITISHCPNSDDDVVGFVDAVGANVIDFHVRHRVAALHELGAIGGSCSEYAFNAGLDGFHLGDHFSFEEAAMVPLAALMASIAIFDMRGCDGDAIIDFRKANPFVDKEMRKALKRKDLKYAFDATSTHGSYNNLSQVLANKGKLTLILPFSTILKDISPHIKQSTTMVGNLWKELSTDHARDNKALGRLGIGKGGRKFGVIFTKSIAT